ncbi:cell filamentation protein Fic [Bacillus thuringiensis serovar vazensis]|uniref:Cell filamentation protein Fic n=1 Tax=Bacillus thuringiensis serovar vazensis TaxID=180867 RepID=A0A243CXN6_BACTU|nr:Fic family protein [Bacillus thuringiensis]EEM86019.1 Fic [Bacillus thuringiensis serovar pulsiensis BGSC 4CC1]OTY74425.1 cell filamentation protein Fic [Bacillus thuringiensis serovar vazensis]
MRNFFEDHYNNTEYNRKIINLLSEISEYKGRLSAYQEQVPHIFKDLEVNIPCHYVKIYIDKKISNKRLKELLFYNAAPQTTMEDSVCCYQKAFSFIYKNFCTLSINPETILELHFQLINYITSDSAKWRQIPLSILGTPESGIPAMCYRPLPHTLIPETMEQLCDQYNSLNNNRELHSLLLIARFMLNYYCIVPFKQGNGKLALILMKLLLLKSGHTFVQYICLDKYIEKNEWKYYDSLYKSSVNWYYNEHNTSFWLQTFLIIILEAYHDLDDKIINSLCNQTKFKRIQDFALKQKQSFTKENIREMFPDIAESTINKALAALQAMDQIKLVSKGRTAHWIKV